MRYRPSAIRIGMFVSVLIFAAACGGSEPETTATPTTSAPTTTAPTAAPTLTPEEAVMRDYGRYWETYSAALLDLDSTRLADVMTGPRLERALAEVANLREQGRAVRIEVENAPVVVSLDGDTAVVVDIYENRSHFVDPATKEALTNPGAPQTLHDSVTLVRVGEAWKVLDTIRSEGSQ